MLAKIIRFLLVLLAVLVISMKIQPFYKKAFEVRESTPQLDFSEVLNDFIYTYYKYDTVNLKNMKYAEDLEGNVYDNSEYMAITPMSNYRQLMHENRYPDSIRGVHLTPEMMQRESKWPMWFGKSSGLQGLKWMFESNTDKLKMDLPDDMFRMTESGIEFVNTNRNRILGVNYEKSKLFNDKMIECGVLFPIKRYYGNPTTDKSKDDGYFIIDAKDDFYQLKMVSDLPVCKQILLPEGVNVDWMYCFDDSRVFGYVFTQSNDIYAMRTKDYSFVQLPIDDYGPDVSLIIVEENYFFIKMRMGKHDGVSYSVMDKNYDLVGKIFSEYRPGYYATTAGRLENYFFPFVSSIVSRGGYHLEVKWYDWGKFIYLNVLLTLMLVAIKAYKRRSFRDWFNYLDFATVLVCGIYGFIAVMIFPNRR